MDWSKETKKIADWMREYNRNAGTKGYVCGISGGLDSAVVAALSISAVGKENTYLYYIGIDSDSKCFEDAESIARALGVELHSAGLTKVFNEYLLYSSMFLDPDTVNGIHSDLSKGNIKARLRMLFIYDMAHERNCLVSGTGNLSELQMGYITKHGDGACDIEPIGDYYKTEIIQMAKVLPIPKRIITKPPSADLWEGQTDEEELGITYKELDRILVGLRTGNRGILDNIPVEQLTKVQDMIRISSHKLKVPSSYKRFDASSQILTLDFPSVVCYDTVNKEQEDG